MAVVPPWMLGRHVTQVVATVQDIASDGTLTDAATNVTNASLVVTTGILHSTLAFVQGLVDEIEFGGTKVLENVTPIHRVRAHHVAVSIAYEFTLTEILRQGAGNTLLSGIWHLGNSSIYKLEFTRARRKWTVYGTGVSYQEGLVRGKNVGRLTCRMVDAGGGSVTFATGVDR
jgi:hypothetical protein